MECDAAAIPPSKTYWTSVEVVMSSVEQSPRAQSASVIYTIRDKENIISSTDESK